MHCQQELCLSTIVNQRFYRHQIFWFSAFPSICCYSICWLGISYRWASMPVSAHLIYGSTWLCICEHISTDSLYTPWTQYHTLIEIWDDSHSSPRSRAPFEGPDLPRSPKDKCRSWSTWIRDPSFDPRFAEHQSLFRFRTPTTPIFPRHGCSIMDFV